MRFKDLKKSVIAGIKFEELGVLGIDVFLFNLPEDKRYSVKVEFKFGANASEFISRGEYEVALNTLVDSYFEKIRHLVPTDLLSEFFEEENKRRDKLKAELVSSEVVCKVESQGRILKKSVIVMRHANQLFSIEFPTNWYSTNATLVRSISRVGFEIIVKPANKIVRTRLLAALGKEFR